MAVMFGSLELQHVQEAQIKKARVEIERFMPHRNVAYRRDRTTLGQTVIVSGEIRESTTTMAFLRIDQLRRFNDGETRVFDLQDGETTPFNAKLVDPSYVLDVSDWIPNAYCVPYSVTLLEVAAT
jgi:hypothetical protein